MHVWFIVLELRFKIGKICSMTEPGKDAMKNLYTQIPGFTNNNYKACSIKRCLISSVIIYIRRKYYRKLSMRFDGKSVVAQRIHKSFQALSQ